MTFAQFKFKCPSCKSEWIFKSWEHVIWPYDQISRYGTDKEKYVFFCFDCGDDFYVYKNGNIEI